MKALVQRTELKMNTQDIREQISNNILRDIQEEVDRRFIEKYIAMTKNATLIFPTLLAAINYIKTVSK